MRSSDVEADNSETQEKEGDLEKPTDYEEKVDFDGDNDQGDTMLEEGVCEVEEKEEAGGEGEETEGVGNRNVADTEDEDEKKKNAELLELPPHGSEVYLGCIPHNVSEEDLRDLCQSVGDVFEVSIVRGTFSGKEKVFAFVTFKTKEMASEAIEKLNKSKFQGKKIKCSASNDKHRLFIGNIPRHWTDEDLRKAVTEIGPGVNSVELLKEARNSYRNRGFALIEYYNHACAEYSMQNLLNPKFKLGNNAPKVKWVKPKYADSPVASQMIYFEVKAVYVQNLPENITRDRLKELFEHHGKITKVVIPPAKAGYEKSRFGFVHFAERSSTMKALEDTEMYEIDGQVLQCSLARPPADHKSSRTPVSQNSTLTTYPLGYGLGGGAYGALDSSYGDAVGFTQPLEYGRGVAPAGTVMMPTPVPDGRIGDAVQQRPGLQQHSHSPTSHGGRRSDDVKNRSRYLPF